MKTYDMDKLPAYKLGYYIVKGSLLKSNWPNCKNNKGWGEPTKIKVPAPCWYIDNRRGISICKCSTLEEGKRTLHAVGGKQAGYVLRYYDTNAEEIHKQDQERKQDYRLGWRS